LLISEKFLGKATDVDLTPNTHRTIAQKSMYAPWIFVVSCLLLSAMNTLFAQPSKRFEHLSLEHGLPQSSALALLQDRRGFLWVGTQEGLARYDGYNFTVYRKHPYQTGVLKGGWVQTLHEDKEGMLWIGTLDGGLQQFNPFTQRFTAYPYKLPENLQATAAVRSISEDSASQSLWLGTNSSGIVVYDKKTKSF
jgi:ligand-binding sensor domain-containing protein